MNWLTNTILPKIRSIVGANEVPDNLWQKCPQCDGMLYAKDLEANMNVCTHCDAHLKFPVKDRLKSMFDDGKFNLVKLPDAPADPLKFRDKKKYSDRLKEAQTKTDERDAIMVAEGQMGGLPVVIAAFNFDFMGGSMGVAVGSAFVAGVKAAIDAKLPFVIFTAAGGARCSWRATPRS